MINNNAGQRQAATNKAGAAVKLQIERYKAWRRALSLRNVLFALHSYAKERRDTTLEKAHRLLVRGRTPEQAMEFLAHTLTNKLLHAPSANLRAAALRGDVELLRMAAQLFASNADAKQAMSASTVTGETGNG